MKRQKALEAKEQEMLAQQIRVEEGEFKDYVEHEMLKYEQPEESIKIDNASQLYSLIDQARKLISQGDLDQARTLYAKLGNLYQELHAEPGDKKRVYYAILELKTDIELAYLA